MNEKLLLNLTQFDKILFNNTSGSPYADSKLGLEKLRGFWHMVQLNRIFQLLCRASWSQSQTHLTCVLEIPISCEMVEDV